MGECDNKNNFENLELEEEDMNEVMEFFEVYRLVPTPDGLCKQDLPVNILSFGTLLQDMGFNITEAEFFDLVKEMDPNNEGYITLAMFLQKGGKELLQRSKVTMDNAKEIFDLMDWDEDKFISISDLDRIVRLFGEELPGPYLKQMLKEVDIDRNDLISFDEFLLFTTGIIE